MPGQIKSLTKAALLIVIAFLNSGVSWQAHKPLARKPAATRSASSAEAVWSLEPVADTYISTWFRDTNYGSATALRIYQNYCKVLFRFDLTTLPTVSTITSAKLFVTFQSVGSSAPTEPRKYFVYDQAIEFVEGEATWVQAARGVSWAADGMSDSKDFNALPYRSQPIVANDPGEYSADLTDLAKALRASGKNAMSVTLFATEFNNRGYVYSREHSNPQERPRLEIQWSRTMPQAKTQDVFAVTRPVDVDGRNSILPDGTNTGLTYLWTIDKPAYGSSYAPGQPLADTPVFSFNPEAPGVYLLRLRVRNSATGEFSEATARVTVGLRKHPRLHIDRKLLSQIKSLRDSGNSIWTRFHNWVKTKPTSSNIEGAIVTSYLLAYMVNGERQYFDWTWDLLRKKIYKNGTDRAGGFTRIVDLYGGSTHNAAYQGGTFIAQVALLYDWGYQQLTPEQKLDLVEWLNEACTYTYVRNPSSSAYFRNDGAAVAYGLAAAAYATLGENPEAMKLLGWSRNYWDEILKALDIMGKGGAAAEGNAYGTAPTASDFIRTANLVFYATGEDLFVSHVWFKQRLLYDAFASYPGTMGGPGSPIKYGYPGVMVEQASVGGDGRRGASWHSVNLRPNGLILSRRFAATEEANVWNWVYRQPSIDQALGVTDCFYDVLYYLPRPALVKPTRLSHFDPSMGYVYIRHDWDSPDATWIAFWAGPHLDSHQHLDQGSFTIFKHRDLAPKTGNYDNNVNHPQHISYYTRTISANTLLIGDPSEVFKNFLAGMGCDAKGAGTKITAPDVGDSVCIPNDGGQRTMSPMGLSVRNPEDFEASRDIFDVAKVVFFEDNGRAVRVVADITNAYTNPRFSNPDNSPKVNKVYRRLVYLRDLDLLFIADTVESTNPNFEKKWLIHALDQLQVGGTVQTIDPGESIHTDVTEARIVVDDTQPSDKDQITFDMRKGYAALLLKTLFPNQFHYRKIGGRDPAEESHPDGYRKNAPSYRHFHRHMKDFWVKDYNEGVIPNHRSLTWMPEYPAEAANPNYIPIFNPGYGRWRLEIEPAPGSQTDYFLNVLKPTLDASAKLPTFTKIETSQTFGAEFYVSDKKYAVIFSKDSLDAPQLELPAAGTAFNLPPGPNRPQTPALRKAAKGLLRRSS